MRGKRKKVVRKYIFWGICLLGCLSLLCGCSDLLEKGDHVEETAVMKEYSAKPEAEENNLMRCYLGDIRDELTPFDPDTEADRRLLSLVYQQMGESDGYMIQTLRNTPEEGHTVYRICSKKDQGRLDADALIWNLYLRCQIGYSGVDEINRMAIQGLEEYRFGASGKQLKNRKKMIKEKREMLCEKYRKEIQKKIIQPALEKEFAWVESLYEDSSKNRLIKKYPEPAALFVRYFAPNTDYKVKGKERKRVLRDVVRQYRGDTKRLSRVTGDRYDEALQGILIGKLWKEQNAGTGNIRGIRKVDDRTVEVETTLYQKKDRKRLENIYLLSSGSGEDVFQKGKLSHHTEKYQVVHKTEEEWLLSAENVKEDSVTNIRVMTGKYSAADCVRKIQSDIWDMAVIKDRLPEEKEETRSALERGNARWNVAALGGILYNPQIVNATAVQQEETFASDLSSLVDSLRINVYQK